MNTQSSPVEQYTDHLKNVKIEIQKSQSIAHLIMSPVGRPCFSLDLLRELKIAQRTADEHDCRYLILSSNIKGVFNFGGDVTYFSEQIRNKNRQALYEYMKACIDVLHHQSSVPERVRIAVVQGDSFGGGFEAALCCDAIIAEENSRFFFPESMFNLFPGMGAFSYLARRTNPSIAKRIITSEHVYSAQEVYDLGVVDQVVSAGVGLPAANKYIRSYERHRNSYDAIRQIVNHDKPVTYDELLEIGNIWVEYALRLSERDLRVMDKISSSQRKFG